MLDPGPCHTCPLATGLLATPSGVHHTCKPEDWRLCDLFYRASKARTEPEIRRRRFHRGRALVQKTRTVIQLFQRSSAR
jgi:hypothetical protein